MQFYISMFPFHTISHRAVVMVFLLAVCCYCKEVASSPTYSLNSQNQPCFHIGSPLVIGFSYASLIINITYPIRKDGNQRTRSYKIITCILHAN
nr:MAG TPA: hypothetical protein [Caudoviricetes sp.]